MDKIETNLDEAFMPPVGLKPVITLYGETFYGSDALNDKFMSIIKGDSRSKQYAPKIKSLLNDKKLVPCFMSKNILKHSIFKIFSRDVHKKSAIAFYAVNKDIVVVMIDNQTKYLAFSNDRMIVESAVHELMHMAAKRGKSKFISVFKKPLYEFYSNYFQLLFQTKDKPDVTLFVNYLFKHVELGKMKSGINLKNIYKELQRFKTTTTLGEEQFERYCIDYIVNIKIRYANFNSWYSVRGRYPHILNNLYRSYVETFGDAFRSNDTLAIQELDVPSEVIAVMSEKKGKYSNLINQGINLC